MGSGSSRPELRPKLSFAVYALANDDCFLRAARTWEAEQRSSTVVEVVASAAHLFLVFKELKDRADRIGAEYETGALFTHASIVRDVQTKSDGLVISPYDSQSPARTRAEAEVRSSMRGAYAAGQKDIFSVNPAKIQSLPKLPWASDGRLELFGCDTGLGNPSIARLFARTQGVVTTGQQGKASFSKSKTRYIETLAGDEKIYLRAFLGKANAMMAAAESLHPEAQLQWDRLGAVPGFAIPEAVEPGQHGASGSW